ncbi:MAG: hypothetical protein ACKVE4_09355 [Dissulfuribacterales bacterium]
MRKITYQLFQKFRNKLFGSSSAALRFTGKGLNVQKVRRALSRLVRLAYEAFYKAVGHIYSWAMTCPPIVIEMKKSGLFRTT